VKIWKFHSSRLSTSLKLQIWKIIRIIIPEQTYIVSTKNAVNSCRTTVRYNYTLSEMYNYSMIDFEQTKSVVSKRMIKPILQNQKHFFPLSCFYMKILKKTRQPILIHRIQIQLNMSEN